MSTMPTREPDGPAEGGRLKGLVSGARERANAEQSRVASFLHKHEGRPVLDVTVGTYRRDREIAGTVVGSALAFRLFLFFVPMLLFLVGLAGVLGRWIEADDATRNASVTGALAEEVHTAFEQPGSTRWVAVVIGLVGIVVTGRTLSKVMVASSSLAWRLPTTTKASLKVIGGLVGLIVGIGLVAALMSRVRSEFGIGVAGVSYVAVLALYVVAWLAISMLLPRATSDPGALLPGAVVVGATLTGMQMVSHLYLPSRIGRASDLYGAIGTTIVTLGWFFIAGRAMVVSMCLDAVIHERLGTISQLIFSLPIVRILPRRSARVRRFFDLDEAPQPDP
jgi:uncharacterized BrkB/YihY/UPF0761 family membrane protein